MEKKTIAQRVQEWIGAQDKACIQETDVSNIKFEENKSKITFANSRRVKCYRLQIDGCIIKEGIRCDNMLIVEETGETFYVELKGVDTRKAIEQLEETSKKVYWSKECTRTAIVVGKNHMPKADTFIQSKMKVFKNQKVDLLIIKSPGETNIGI